MPVSPNTLPSIDAPAIVSGRTTERGAVPAILVEGLGKEYVIGRRESGRQTFREMLISTLGAPLQRMKRLRGVIEEDERFWALKDVSFEVQPGEVVGVIGRNGAGKSTLLKILCRITDPTQGRVEIQGRVASLLEVGTGFHPELTGRENIYLNGAILGMTQAEIGHKFSEMVIFAGVEKFLDTPVKRYSSGMYVRLAFAVAAHMEPEILVVDEVLAVGDAEFQKKCLGKMTEVAERGRTVIFVSHNLQAVSTLCDTALVLSDGVMTFRGGVNDAIRHYRKNTDGSMIFQYKVQHPKDLPHCTSIHIYQEEGDPYEIEMHRAIVINIEVELCGENDATCTLVVTNAQGVIVCQSTEEFGLDSDVISRATKRKCIIPPNVLNASEYTLTLALGSRSSGQLFEKLQDVLHFECHFSGPGADKMESSSIRSTTAPGVIQWSAQEN